MKPVDVAVIGGGPVGLAAAAALRQSGLSLRLFESRDWPRDSACGEGILPQGLAALKALGVEPLGMPIRGIEYHDPRSGVARGNFGENIGMGVRRLELSRALLEVCRDGVELHPNCPVKSLARSDGNWCLQTSDGEFFARYIVIADGLRSRFRNSLGMQGQPPLAIRRFGWRQHLHVTSVSDAVEVHWADGCEAYLTPVAEQEIGVAFLWGEGFSAPSGDQRLAAWLEHFPALRERFSGAEVSSKGMGAGPMAQAASAATFEGGCFIGDAYCFFDGITGEGLSAGFSQSLLLRDLLPSLLEGAPRSGLEKAINKTVKAKFRLAKIALKLHRSPRLRRRVISLFQAYPKLFDLTLRRTI